MPTPPSPPSRPPIDLRLNGSEVWLAVRVQPKASRDQLRVDPEGRVKASITAAPADGEANAALCKLLARQFGVSKTAVRIAQGEKSRDKVVALRGTTLEAVRATLDEITES